MKINIFLKPGAKKPSYQKDGNSAGFDFYSSQEVTLKPGETKLIDTGVVIDIPKNYGLFLLNRSSSAYKKNLLLKNGVGLVDPGYCGSEDTVKFMFTNVSGNETYKYFEEDPKRINQLEVKFKKEGLISKAKRNVFFEDVNGDLKVYQSEIYKEEGAETKWYYIEDGKNITISKGERIGQGVVLETPKIEFNIENSLKTKINRGGFGSSGDK